MIIFRYLVKEVYGTLLATTGVLLLVLISNQFIHYLTQAAAGVVPVHTVMQMMSLQVPLLLGLLLPLGLFLGILMAYGRLYVDREMTVLSACGMSKAKLIGMTMIFSAAVSVVVAVLMLIVEPEVESYKRKVLTDAAASSPLERIFSGQFTTLESAKLVLYVNDLSRNHKQLQNVFVVQQPDAPGKPWNAMMATSAKQMIDPNTRDRFIVFNNGYRYTGIPGQNEFQTVKYDAYGVRIEQNAVPEDKRIETMSTQSLWQQRHGHPRLQAELQWRVSLPLSVFILALLAIPLSQVHPRQGRYAQLVPAFLLYIIYADLMFMGQAWLQKGKVSSGIGMWWIHALMLFIAVLLLIRFVGWSQVKKTLRWRRGTQP